MTHAEQMAKLAEVMKDRPRPEPGSSRRRTGSDGPRKGSHEWKAVHGTPQLMAARRGRKRTADGVVHANWLFRQDQGTRQITFQLSKGGRR